MNSLKASYPKVRTLFGSTDSILAGGERRHKCVRALICTLVYNYLSSPLHDNLHELNCLDARSEGANSSPDTWVDGSARPHSLTQRSTINF